MAEKTLGQVYNRQAEVDQELLRIWHEELAEFTVIPGVGALDNKEWLEAEREALHEYEDNIIDVVTLEGSVRYDESAGGDW